MKRLTIGLNTWLFLCDAACPPEPPLPAPPIRGWWLDGGVETLWGCRGSSLGVGGNGRDGGWGSGTTIQCKSNYVTFEKVYSVWQWIEILHKNVDDN